MASAIAIRVLEKMRNKATTERSRALANEPQLRLVSFDDSPVTPEGKREVFTDLDDSPSRERMRNPNSWDSRPHQGLNLKPLMRWLQAQIGQPWDTVWSSLTTHPQLKKLREHASHFVPSVTDEGASRWGKLYRDEGGIVRLRSRQPEPPKPQDWWVDLPTGEVAICVKGVYYAFTTRTVAQLPYTVYHYSDSLEFFRGKVGDFFRKGYKTVSYGRYHSDAPVVHEITGKRQLGSSELKKYGLRK